MMDGCCTPKCNAIKLLVLGLILILVTIYVPSWDTGVVLGVLLIIMAVVKFFMPNCCCHGKTQEKPAKRR